MAQCENIAIMRRSKRLDRTRPSAIRPMIDCTKNWSQLRRELRVRSLASPGPAMQPAFVHPEFVRNVRLLEWVSEIARLTQPASIHWCDGSQAEYEDLCSRLVAR